MSEPSFITDFIEKLQKLDRRALAILRRSASFAPGAYPAAYPYVEHHVGADWHPQDSRRQALYITAMLFALHPRQAEVSQDLGAEPVIPQVGLEPQFRIGLDGVEPLLL